MMDMFILFKRGNSQVSFLKEAMEHSNIMSSSIIIEGFMQWKINSPLQDIGATHSSVRLKLLCHCGCPNITPVVK